MKKKKHLFVLQVKMIKLICFEFLEISDFDELFESIPKELRTKKVDIPKGLSEMEMMQHIKKLHLKIRLILPIFVVVVFMIIIYLLQ